MMTTPIFLWAFLALIPLLAIYFLKVRPRKKSTPAYFLWEKIFSEKKASSLFNKLRDLLSLIIMMIAFSLLVLALTRPEFSKDDRKDLLLLVDHSASMSAKDGIRTRLEVAKNAAKDIATALNGNQRAAVAAIGKDIEFLSHLSESPRELIDAVNKINASDFPLANQPLAGLAKDSDWTDQYRIILISDGNFSGAESLPESIELYKIGDRIDNLGIVGADLERLPDGRLGLYYQVTSSFKEEQSVDLILQNQETGTIAKLIPLNVKPGLNEPETFYLEDADYGKWVVEIDREDGFSKDNQAYLTIPPPRPVRVGVQAENRFFYETSVVAFEQGGGLLRLVTDQPEIVIKEGSADSSSDLTVIFTPNGNSPWWKSLGEDAPSVAPREVIEGHPILQHLDVASMTFLGAKNIEPIDGALVLVESEDGNPLIYRATKEGKAALIVNIDPLESNLYFSAWFPVLVYGAATHLAGREEELEPSYRPGDTLTIPGHRDGVVTTLAGLNEEEEPLQLLDPTYGPIQRLGFFDFTNTSGNWSAASSLLSKSESALDNSSITATNQPISQGHALSYWLIVLAIILLTIESILYHRRKVG